MLAVIATEIAVLAASSAPNDQLAAQAIERALGERVVHREAVLAVRTDTFAPLAQARALIAQARKQDLNVDFDAAQASLAKAIGIFSEHSGTRDELADAWLWSGVVAVHANRSPAEFFSKAKGIDPSRVLTPYEVHPDIAARYSKAAIDPDVTSMPTPRIMNDAPEEVCDLLWCEGVIVVGVSEQKGRASLVGTRYDANARAFTERAVAGNAHDLIDALERSPAFAREQPSLVLPPEPPPLRVWQRTWFWTAVGGAAAALAGSLIYADATRDVHTNVSVPAGVFGGR